MNKIFLGLMMLLIIASCSRKKMESSQLKNVKSLESYRGNSQIVQLENGESYSLLRKIKLEPVNEIFIRSKANKNNFWIKMPKDGIIELSGLTKYEEQDITMKLQSILELYMNEGIKTFFLPKGEFLLETIHVMPGLKLIGDQTKFTRIPNQTKFSRMFTTSKFKHSGGKHTQDSLVFKGLNLDGNLENQGNYKNYQLEHQALIFLSADKKFFGKQKVIIRDCNFSNCAGDAIHVYTNVDAEIYNCTAKDVFRGGVTVTGGNSIVKVKDFKAYGKLHASGIDIEVDGMGYGDSYEVNIEMEDIELEGDCDIGIKKGTFIGRNIICHNAPFHFLATNGKIEIYDSQFVGGGYKEAVIKFPKDIKFDNCTFLLKDDNEKENFGANIYWSTNSYSGKNQKLSFIDCKFQNDSKSISNTSYALYTRADSKEKNNLLKIENCSFNGPFDYSYYMRQGGNVSMNNLKSLTSGMIRLWSVNNEKYTHNYSVDIKNVKNIFDLNYLEDARNSIKMKESKNISLKGKSARIKTRTVIIEQ